MIWSLRIKRWIVSNNRSVFNPLVVYDNLWKYVDEDCSKSNFSFNIALNSFYAADQKTYKDQNFWNNVSYVKLLNPMRFIQLASLSAINFIAREIDILFPSKRETSEILDSVSTPKVNATARLIKAFLLFPFRVVAAAVSPMAHIDELIDAKAWQAYFSILPNTFQNTANFNKRNLNASVVGDLWQQIKSSYLHDSAKKQYANEYRDRRTAKPGTVVEHKDPVKFSEAFSLLKVLNPFLLINNISNAAAYFIGRGIDWLLPPTSNKTNSSQPARVMKAVVLFPLRLITTAVSPLAKIHKLPPIDSIDRSIEKKIFNIDEPASSSTNNTTSIFKQLKVVEGAQHAQSTPEMRLGSNLFDDDDKNPMVKDPLQVQKEQAKAVVSEEIISNRYGMKR